MHPHGKRSCMWLSDEGIGDEGAKQLAKSLANNTALTSLELRGTRWCNVTPIFVRPCIHTRWCSTAMQSQTKPNVNLALTLTLIRMPTLTLFLTFPLTVTITLTPNPQP